MAEGFVPMCLNKKLFDRDFVVYLTKLSIFKKKNIASKIFR